MIKIGSEFLDFNAPVEMERRIKLFESIDETLGDFSYSFELANTSHNLKILGFPLSDVSSKTIYNGIDAELLDDSGSVVYRGILRVERRNRTTISCSFFSGNYNWISRLSGYITSDIDFSDLDTDLSETGIANSWDNTDGVIFPLIDTGTLVSRSSANLLVDDFTGMVFVKTIFKRIFDRAKIHLTGELFNDPIYNTMLVSRLNVDPDGINARSSFVNKSVGQDIVAGLLPTFPDPNEEIIVFDDDTSYPYFDGDEDNFSSNSYTADVRMRVQVEVFIDYDEISFGPTPTINHIIDFKLYVNGTAIFIQRSPEGTGKTATIKREIILEAGDVLDVRGYVDANSGIGILTVKQNSYIKITPIFLYRAFGNSMVPKWTKADFVNNILSSFCAISDFDPVSNILTINLFNKIKSKDAIDISEHVTITDTDTSEFVSGFSKRNLFKYGDSDADSIKSYNFQYTEPYASGVIEIDNIHVSPVGTIFESGFKSPVSYINTRFSASLDRAIFYELEGTDNTEFTSVTDSFGSVRLNMADASMFVVGGLVRIEEASRAGYNGDWFVKTVSTNFIVIDAVYSGDSTGKVTRMRHVPANNDDVYVFINTIYRDDSVSKYSKKPSFQIQDNNYFNVGYAFFNLLNMGLPINTYYRQSLAFGVVNNVLSYQRTMLETYWPLVSRVLSDPVKEIAVGNLPKNIYNKITPLNPIQLRTLETSNLYYINLIQGYKGSEYPCTLELIKLS